MFKKIKSWFKWFCVDTSGFLDDINRAGNQRYHFVDEYKITSYMPMEVRFKTEIMLLKKRLLKVENKLKTKTCKCTKSKGN